MFKPAKIVFHYIHCRLWCVPPGDSNQAIPENSWRFWNICDAAILSETPNETKNKIKHFLKHHTSLYNTYSNTYIVKVWWSHWHSLILTVHFFALLCIFRTKELAALIGTYCEEGASEALQNLQLTRRRGKLSKVKKCDTHSRRKTKSWHV